MPARKATAHTSIRKLGRAGRPRNGEGDEMTTRRRLEELTSKTQDRIREIVEGLNEGFLSLDERWRLTECNQGAVRLLDCHRDNLIGRNFWNATGIDAQSALGVLCHRVASGRSSEEAEVSLDRTRDKRLLLVRVFPIDCGVAAVLRDITEQREAERALAESQIRYHELAEDSPAPAWVSRADGQVEFINQAMADALGRPRQELLGDGWLASLDPEDAPAFLTARHAARLSHSPIRYEGRFRHADGSLRVVQLYGRPRFDAHGAFKGHIGMATDVTEQRDAVRRQQLIVNELNHRVKNALVTVQSIVNQTLRECGVDRLVENLVAERLLALADAHDLLTQESWQGADLVDIVQLATASYSGVRVTVQGPPVRVGPKVGMALSLALHELATNAAKHGALSRPRGRVRVSWKVVDSHALIEWRETGGPPVEPPTRTGFGLRLLGRGMLGELGAPAKITYARSGLVCELSAPIQTPNDASRDESWSLPPAEPASPSAA
jgi:PAS domain S-box-containing protein